MRNSGWRILPTPSTFAPLSEMPANLQKIKLGLVQMRCSNNPEENLAKAVARTREAAAQGAQIICLQELFRSLYFCQVEDHDQFALAEEIPGPSSDALAAVAKQCGVVVVASLFEKRAPGVYHNTAAVLDANGALLGRYRKMHIPDDPLFYEKFYFAPGDLGFQAWDTKHGKIGVCVCWDQWYPEAARLMALRGAQILFYPTAIGWHPSEKAQYGAQQHDSWETIQRSHAIANGCFVAVPNRVGHERVRGDDGREVGEGIEFWGQSFVADPSGRIIAKAAADAEEILIVEVDLGAIDQQRTHWPFLRDRRVDAYAGLEKRFLD